MSHPIIVWFRQDLRCQDNPALFAACQDAKIVPIYILDDENSQEWSMGGASRIWLYHSLIDLNASLDGNLHVFKGNPEKILSHLIQCYSAKGVYWNRCYEPWRMQRDEILKKALLNTNKEVHTFNASLLWEPWRVKKSDGTLYKVFTPFYKNGCLALSSPRLPLQSTLRIDYAPLKIKTDINQLNLLPPAHLNWHHSIEASWKMTEKSAHHILDLFLEHALDDYKTGRDYPNKKNVSKLSPYLHFGQISPHQVWHKLSSLSRLADQVQAFLRQLAWREFSYNLLYHFSHLPETNLQPKFDSFPWREDKNALRSWQRGETGCPIVDAGMRELWNTGYIHNRVRMLVASFLVKNLLLHWHHGQRWFWDCLVDADLANNSASWQWVSGCGTDAAPYFRIFNPIVQSKRFDARGDYIRFWVPELKHLSSQYIHAPWMLSKEILGKANKTYPKLIVNLDESRKRALVAFQSLKDNTY